ncbi:polysaccharide biosynthesis tyrosine autokinase [Ferrimonas pelagia]|uniref:Polysaccharide biosynthesis tyrosine autokinase n=1 Tax=Ferrimonas pelagia TaxID=1177826 RepID=A0ABP9EHG6_9GAMM
MTQSLELKTRAMAASDDIDLGKLFATLADGKKWIVLGTVLATCLGVAAALLATPVYRADALVQVEEKSTGIPGLEGVSDLFASESSSKTEIELIRSRRVLGSTVDELDLSLLIEPKRFPLLGGFMARRYAETTPAGAWLSARYNWGGERIEIGQLLVPDSLQGEVLTLEVGAGETYRLYGPADELLLQGVVGERAMRGEVSLLVQALDTHVGAHIELVKQPRFVAIQDLSLALGISERGKDSGILSLTMTGEDPQQIAETLDSVANFYFLQNVKRMAAQAEQSLEFLQRQLPDVKADLDIAEQALNRYQLQVQSVDVSLETEGVLKQLVDIEAKLSEVQFKEAEMNRLYTAEHPSYKALQEQKQSLLVRRAELLNVVESLPETQQEILRLRRDVEVNQQIYLSLLNHMQELSIMKAGTVGNVRIVDTAESDPKPVKPKKALIVAVALVLGGVLSVGFVLVRAAMNRGIESPEELEEAGLVVYASVPVSDELSKIEKEQRKLDLDSKLNQGHSLLAIHRPADLAIEALRGLRTSLHFAMLEAKNNIVVVSGSAPNLGKSFVSANLATVMALAGQRVLLIDCDMRKGYLQRTFGLNWDDGLSDYLAGQVSMEKAVRTSVQENLDLIPRGTLPPNPAELIMHPRFKALLDWASEEYDFVVIDTPPILAVTDAALVARHAGTTMMIARHMMTPLKEVEYACQRFATNGVQVNGVILNALEKRSGGYGSYGYYHYEYGTQAPK